MNLSGGYSNEVISKVNQSSIKNNKTRGLNNQNEIEKQFPCHSSIYSNHLASEAHKIQLEMVKHFEKIKKLKVAFSLAKFCELDSIF